jgi:hypothetical protein
MDVMTLSLRKPTVRASYSQSRVIHDLSSDNPPNLLVHRIAIASRIEPRMEIDIARGDASDYAYIVVDSTTVNPPAYVAFDSTFLLTNRTDIDEPLREQPKITPDTRFCQLLGRVSPERVGRREQGLFFFGPVYQWVFSGF